MSKEYDDRIAQAPLHNYMERFTERWAPADRRENAEFQADFLLVIQAIHRDAMKPMEKAMTAAFSIIPMASIFPNPDMSRGPDGGFGQLGHGEKNEASEGFVDDEKRKIGPIGGGRK